MNSIEARNIIKKANDAFKSEERLNFNELYNSALGMCRPTSPDVWNGSVAGEKKDVNRYIDIGIQSLDAFTAGMTSTLIPKGSRFFEFIPSKRIGYTSDDIKRWLADCSKITLDILNESNFYSEMSKALEDLGVIGTTLMLTEPSSDDGVKYKTFYISKFAICEDHAGKIDTVYFKMPMSARQIVQKFGMDNLPNKILNCYENNKDDEIFNIIHSIFPRKDYEKDTINLKKQKYASIYILEDTGDVLLESGFSAMPASVCRWSQASNETYGRSPAMQAQGNLAMANQMEYTKLKSAQRIASPQWLLPDDGSVRNLNNQPGGIVYYNATNPNGIPQQLSPRDMPNITDSYQQQKLDEIRKAFFMDVFDPMQEVTGNTTATEVNARMSIARQNLVPKVNRVIDELLEPTLKRTFKILLDAGYFPEPPQDIDISDIKINMMSTTGLILKQAEAVGALQLVESVAMLAQAKPQMLDYIDEDELIKLVAFSNAVPTSIIRSDLDVEEIREARAQQQQQVMQQQEALASAQAYRDLNKSVEPNSPASLLI